MDSGAGRMEQDYLKLIWKAQEWTPAQITTNELAAALGVAASTVSGNLKKLARDGLIEHAPYRAIELTESGRRLALRMVRRHRLIETYLVRQHGYAWDEVHEEAEILEHAMSDKLLDRIDVELGRPASDPHGDPIPAADGSLIRPEARQLSVVDAGQCGIITRVSDESSDLLKYLRDLAITLGSHVQVEEQRGYAGSVALLVRDATQVERQVELAHAAADAIWLSTECD